MATARKLPSGSWRVNQYIETVNGKRVYKSFTATSKKDAEYDAAEYVKNYKRMQEPANLMVGEAIDKYIENKTAVLSPETIRGYKKLRKNTLQDISKTRLSELTQSLVQSAVNADARTLSPKTVRNAHGLLSSALLEYYPAFRLTTKLPQRIKTRIAVPEKGAIEKLLEEGVGSVVGAIVLFGAVLGLRRSEMCALTWADVDLTAGVISINKAIVQNDKKEWVQKSPKSYAGTRQITLPAFASEYLKAIPKTDDRIIPITPCAAANRFRRLAEKQGLKLRLHDLRHYNASVMLSLGVPDKYAMERLGHATSNMLKTVYQHTMQDKQIQVADQIDSYFRVMQHEMQHVDE